MNLATITPLPSHAKAEARLSVDRRPLEALKALLQQLREVITLMPGPMYLARPSARVSGSVGEHVRHCLDHVSALVAAMASGELSYDHRRRGTTVETEATTAVNEIERLFVRLDRVRDVRPHQAIAVSSLVSRDGPPLHLRSTVAREVAFVVQHTIHHCALIALLVEWQGWRVPYGFGVAPSTIQARAAAR